MRLTLGVVQSVAKLQVHMLGDPLGLVLNNAWNIHPSSVSLTIFIWCQDYNVCNYTSIHRTCDMYISPYIFTAWYININISFPYRRMADKLFSLRVFRFHKMWAIF